MPGVAASLLAAAAAVLAPLVAGTVDAPQLGSGWRVALLATCTRQDQRMCWVWGRIEARGALIDSPYTRRVRYIVLRNAADNLDTWFDETRDIAADFRRAFGDEAQALPPLVAVLIGGDADNTHQQTQAHVSDLRFEP